MYSKNYPFRHKTKLGIETVSSRLLQRMAKPAKTAVSPAVSPRSSLLAMVSKLELELEQRRGTQRLLSVNYLFGKPNDIA